MARFIIGCVAAAVAMFILGFVLYGTPLSMLAYATASDAVNASVQNALAAGLPKTGTYIVPWPSSAEGTILYGRGPVATIHYNTGGFPVADPGAMIGAFIHMLVSVAILGLALMLVAGRIADFGSRARLVLYFTLSASIFINLADPIWAHHDWTYAVYRFLADFIILAAGGLVIARWFLPRPASPQ